jgi:hypothetical protein
MTVKTDACHPIRGWETEPPGPSLEMEGDSNMTRRFGVLTALALTAVLAAAPAVHGGVNSSRLTYLTFNAPVALPGVTLTAGTYAFELADPMSASNVVLVRSRNRAKVFFLGFTQRVAGPASSSGGSPVRFGEAASGEPRPITVWYPPEMSDGLQFVYR